MNNNLENVITPLELLNLYFSGGRYLGDRKNKLWQKMNALLTWDNILNKGYQSDLSPLLFFIITKALPRINGQVNIRAKKHMTYRQIVPDNILLPLREYYYESLQRNVVLLHELKLILKAFNEACIDVIILKGGDIAERIYPNIALRPMGDIDLLIRKKDIQKTEEVLSGLGYCNKIEQYFCRTFIDKFHYVYFKNSRNAQQFKLEIHWDIVHRSHYVSIDLNQVWNKAFFNNTLKNGSLTLDTDHLLKYLCWHGCLHNYMKIAWLCDLAFIINKYGSEFKWNVIFQESKKWKMLRAVLFSLYLLENCLGIRINNKKYKIDNIDLKLLSHLFIKSQNKHSYNVTGKSTSGLFTSLIIDNRKDRYKFLLLTARELKNIRKKFQQTCC